MNFYQKHLPEGQKIEAIIHQHWLVVMDSFILWLSFWALIPSFLYYQSERIRDMIPFFVIEILLALVFLKILYELYNWHNDVWIVTDTAVYDLEWSLFKTNIESVHHENIEGLEVDKNRIWDSIFNKGDIIIHKFWDEEIAIYNAYAPYKSVNIIEQFIHPEEEEEEQDKFDMIMDALSGVVSEHLKKHGVWEYQEEEDNWIEVEKQDIKDSPYTLDLSNGKN